MSGHELIHRHLVEALAPTLSEIFQNSLYADKAIEKAFKSHRKWGSRDRKFFAEQIYEIVRWWKKYWFLLDEEESLQPNSLLRLWGVHWLVQGRELPHWPEFQNIQWPAETEKKMKSQRAVLESIPDWLDEKGESELGSRWDSILHSLNAPASVDLRVNRLRAQREQVQKELLKEGIETQPIATAEDGLELVQRKNVFSTKAFHSGHFEVQDRASQQVAPFLKLAPGLRVIDACAGAGGKSLHMASLMKNKGKIISMDIHEWKLKELRNRAIRNGVDVIETKIIESSKTMKRMDQSADRVLLDVPCSGLGVLRRNPDAKWKLKSTDFKTLAETQALILQNYSGMTKVGGLLVYATCSFLPSENELQIESFLKANPAWGLEEQIRIDPDQGRGDGFFAARLIRKS
ncbi:MAG: RsmB/NOP family class I SAM-dependent RNA methyltransferase [Pseudobdellovibrionaceae bacterium]